MQKALYRKWRPKSFDEVYGQDHITSILQYEITNAKFSHAYLFCGSRGTGKTTCAKILAKAVNCHEPVNGNPCGRCEACRLIDGGAETDIIEMDAASNNGVDDIRDIRDQVVYTPSTLKYRVYIIDEVHMLSTSAFNALLKTLEEPPEHVVFILATTELHKLPATIISRCQRFDFRRITTSVLRDHLLRIAKSEGIEITESAAMTLAKHAQGGMRDAISLLELCASSRRLIDDGLVAKTVGLGGREQMLDVVRAIVSKDHESVFAIIDETVRSSRDISVFWQELMSVYRDILVVKTAKEPSRYLDLTDSETEALSSIAESFSIEMLSYHSQLINEGYFAMLKGNAVRRTVAELTLVKMCDARLSPSPDAMLARIAALERELLSRPTNAITEMDISPKEEKKTAVKKTKSEPPVEEVKTPKNAESRTLEVKAAQQKDDGRKIRKLTPFKGRAEVLEIMDSQYGGMNSSFFKNAKWYLDENEKIVLKFEKQFEIERMRIFDAEPSFLNAVSQVTGRTYGKSDLKCESDEEKKADDTIDKIIEAAENA